MPVNIIQADGKYVSDAHWRFDRDKVISRISCAGQIGRQRRAMGHQAQLDRLAPSRRADRLPKLPAHR
jgi:hypothetical protein